MFPITWKEAAFVVVGFVLMSILSLIFAVSAEISIEIHYFDKLLSAPTIHSATNGNGASSIRLSFEALDVRERSLNLHHRVTTVEPEYAALMHNNRQHRGSGSGNGDNKRVRLQRVVHITSLGHPQPLLVVEEQDYISDYGGKNETGGGLQRRRKIQPPEPPQPKVLPKLCQDGYTVGFDNWVTLKNALKEANSLSVDRFVRWSRFFAEADTTFTGTFDDESLYYEDDVVVDVCPGITLRARKGPIYINAPNIILSCEGCSIEVGGSHFSFGPHAKNVLIRGFTFKGARTSSLVFFQTGADVAFEGNV